MRVSGLHQSWLCSSLTKTRVGVKMQLRINPMLQETADDVQTVLLLSGVYV